MIFLLIFPPKCFSTKEPLPPLGLLYVASALKKAGAEVRVIDSALEKYSYKDLKTIIRQYRPDVIGTTSFTEFRFESFRLLSLAKKISKDIITMIGGPHVSLTPADTMAYQEDIDILVRGEAEITVKELYQALKEKRDLAGIKGISYRYNGKVIHNDDRPPVENLDTLEFPARELLPMEKYKFFLDVPGKGMLETYHIMTSRGCPFECSFCATSRLAGRKWRARSPENIVKEVELLLSQYKARALWFYDDTFNMKKDRLIKICDLIGEHKLEFSFTCSLRLDLADRELLEKLKGAGCFSVFYGIESVSETIISRGMGKRLNFEKLEENAGILDELGIIKLPSYIIGFPNETYCDAKMTIDFMKKHGGRPALSFMRIYPGTRIEETARELKILPEDYSWGNPKERRGFSLNAAHGSAPIFMHKMNFRELSDLSLEWADYAKVPLAKRVVKTVRGIKNIGDIMIIFTLGKTYILKKLKKVFKKNDK